MSGRLLVVSNRLPVIVMGNGPADTRLRPASGGLVTALAPVMRARGGVWFGWPGCAASVHEAATFDTVAAGGEAGYDLHPVSLSAAEVDGFYHGFSNEIIWPLFHDLHPLCNFAPGHWRAYRQVNRKYAAEVAAAVRPGDIVWVHDYQLICVGGHLRRLGPAVPLGFFLHIPFPSPDIFMMLPWRVEILRALLEYDLVGFQTDRDLRNFMACVRTLLPDVRLAGRGRSSVRFHLPGRVARAGTYPIGIDYDDFYRRAAEPRIVAQAQALRHLLPRRQLILGIDRLDYTKGIPERLDAFARALERYPDIREKVTLIQVVVPSRNEIVRYQELKARIENLVGEINGRFTRPGGWVPIHYVFRYLEPDELLAYYRAAQVALVTPLKDGMNLVAKEYCACSPDEDCVLILSEFAGAANQLADGAILVNPCDLEGVAAAIHQAVTMDAAERRTRMRRLRRRVRRDNVYRWVGAFLDGLSEAASAAPPWPQVPAGPSPAGAAARC